MTKISCILPISKDLKYLDKSIQSILNQSFKNFELIIIINTHDKKINRKLYNYSKLDKRIKIFSKTSGNLSELLNYGISKAKGEYIARQDSDDISHEKRFEMQVNWFKKKSKKFKAKVLCGTNGYLINEKNVKEGKLKFIKFSHEEIKNRLIFANCFVHSSIMVNYRILRNKFKYEKYFEYSQDYDLWTRLIGFGEACNLKNKLIFYRYKKKLKKTKKFYHQILFAILVATNYYHYTQFKKFKKFSNSFDVEIKKLEKNPKLKNHIKILRYIYGKKLRSQKLIFKKLSFFEILKNIKNTLLLKTLIK